MKNLLSVFLLSILGIINAQNECYHTVVAGDNLYRIGIYYGTNEAEVKKNNQGITAA